MNEARTIAYVSRDGGPEVEYTPQGATLANPLGNVRSDGSQVYGTFENANGDTFYLRANNGSHGIVGVNSRELGASNYAQGYGGLQSAPEDLPDSANYSGYFNTQGDITSSGNMTLNVDFANGDLGGSLTGNAYGTTTSAFTGTIDGSVSDSRVSGAATIEGDATGTLDLAGAVYGTDEEYLFGGIAGTLTVGEEDLATGGRFTTYRQSSQIAN